SLHTATSSILHSISTLTALLPSLLFFFTDTPPTEISPLSLHDALPILLHQRARVGKARAGRLVDVGGADIKAVAFPTTSTSRPRSEEHTSELQSLTNLVCRLLLEKKKQRQHS